MDGSDLWYDSSFDERWCMVASGRSTDANPRERFMHRQARTGGDGGSSHREWVAFREKDNAEVWTDASDGNCEERRLFRQNHHANVVALVADASEQRELTRDSANRVSIGLPVGDTHSDGDADLTCGDTLSEKFRRVALWRAQLSAVGNARGGAGYLTAGLASTVHMIRHHVFPSALGAWSSEIPLEQVDAMPTHQCRRCSPSTRAESAAMHPQWRA